MINSLDALRPDYFLARAIFLALLGRLSTAVRKRSREYFLAAAARAGASRPKLPCDWEVDLVGI